MKTLRLALFIAIGTFLFTTNSNAQSLASSAVGAFEFESLEIDYGTINKGENGERTFKFKNNGNAPIVITDVKASCGCTVPTKPKGPVMPGQTAEIGVKYDTKKVGAFSKTITITSNAAESTKILKIKGNVVDNAIKTT